ncbi:MAG: Hpt domain-containing protein [Spirochaetes bacterium]|uniref:Hpt domain-containing protein n=1 Tax=Candidatus Ornithospirochaeta stercoripullorum TaxID=2840899 RepID=A0A9D9H6S4_9SPIO|nr:Hpt domain-containing protein [Candidatus Ornithospirochaeta stercoripullorum]
MDYESVIEDFCGDVSALKDALKAFASTDCQNLSEAVEKNDDATVKKEAHRIRKSAEKLGLEKLKVAAARLEEVNEEKVPADYAHLASIFTSTVDAIKKEGL